MRRNRHNPIRAARPQIQSLEPRLLLACWEAGPIPAAAAGFASGPSHAAPDCTAERRHDLTLNGSAKVVPVPPWLDDDDGLAVQLTDNVNDQVGSAFFTHARDVNRDRVYRFSFLLFPGSGADGFAFVIQGNTPTAVGGGAAGLGYAGTPNSLAIKFDIFHNGDGTPVNRTGVYTNGAMDDGGTDIGFVLDSIHVIDVRIDYDADAEGDFDFITVRIEDRNNPTLVFEQTYTSDSSGHPLDIDTILGTGGCGYVGFTGATGGLNVEQNILAIDVGDDPPPPPPPTTVRQVFVNGPGLTGQTTANGQRFRTWANVDNTFGHLIPGGQNQTKPVPWIGGVDRIALRFDRDVGGELEQGDLAVRGVNVRSYDLAGFSYDSAARTGVWTLSAPIFNDKVRLFLDDSAVPDFDGEWADGSDAYPSGDGRVGGDFDFRLNVLAGDATRDGRVNALDLSFIRQRLNRTATNPGSTDAVYSPFGDINADGLSNAIDLAAARQRVNRQLPTGEPAATALLERDDSATGVFA